MELLNQVPEYFGSDRKPGLREGGLCLLSSNTPDGLASIRDCYPQGSCGHSPGAERRQRPSKPGW